jgi:hypothetical protein
VIAMTRPSRHPVRPRFALSLGLVTGCIAALALPASVPAAGEPATALPADAVALLRAQGPAALDQLLVRWDAMNVGRDRDALALTIDRVAAQRYATASRLYWYTDLPAAETAARAQHKPILALRMLGRLDEDLSCANSRLFRATLYANTKVSAFLRDSFVLYWSTERPVPQVTIDFGDGRKLQGTTTGNSAHYVLDENGTVLDVLPGLYAPVAFTAELTQSLALANRVRSLDAADRRTAITAYHANALEATTKAWAAAADTPYVPRARRLMGGDAAESAVARAQDATVAKALIEVPQLRRIASGIDPGAISPDETAQWAAVGQRTWGLTSRKGAARPRVFDDASRALVARLHNAVPEDLVADADALDTVIARLEQHVVADSALNQFVLRQQIHGHMRKFEDSFQDLNQWVYANVFHTPNTDAWLGLAPRTDFTGLPGDGLVAP